MKKAFKVGDKVTLKEGSTYYRQQGSAPYGTVLELNSGENDWHQVEWENGQTNNYPTQELVLYAAYTPTAPIKVFKTRKVTIKGLEREVMVAVLVVEGLVRAGYSVRMLEDEVVEGRSEHIATGRAMNDRTNLVDMELGRGMDKKYILHSIADDLLTRIERGRLTIKGVKEPRKAEQEPAS